MKNIYTIILIIFLSAFSFGQPIRQSALAKFVDTLPDPNTCNQNNQNEALILVKNDTIYRCKNGSYQAVSTTGGTQLTQEEVEDYIGGLFTDSAELDFTYDDGANTLTATLKTTGVTPGSYGDGSNTPVLTIDSKGRITSASTAAISGGGGISWTSPTTNFLPRYDGANLINSDFSDNGTDLQFNSRLRLKVPYDFDLFYDNGAGGGGNLIEHNQGAGWVAFNSGGLGTSRIYGSTVFLSSALTTEVTSSGIQLPSLSCASATNNFIFRDSTTGNINFKKSGTCYDLTSAGGGLSAEVASSYANLAAAISAIGATPTTLYLDVDTTCNEANTIPATLIIERINQATITDSGSCTIDFDGVGLAKADDQLPLFINFEEGDITFTGSVYPDVLSVSLFKNDSGWGSTNLSPALQSATLAMQNKRATIKLYPDTVRTFRHNTIDSTPIVYANQKLYFTSGDYYHNGDIPNYPNVVTGTQQYVPMVYAQDNVTVYGDGRSSRIFEGEKTIAIVTNYGMKKTIFTNFEGQNKGIIVKDLAFHGNDIVVEDNSQSTVLLGNCNNCEIAYNYFKDTNGYAGYIGVNSGVSQTSSPVSDSIGSSIHHNVSDGLNNQHFGFLGGRNGSVHNNIGVNLNTVDGETTGMFVDIEPNFPNIGVYNLDIYENIVDGRNANRGWTCVGLQKVGASIFENITVKNNTCIGSDAKTFKFENADVDNAGDYITVTGNGYSDYERVVLSATTPPYSGEANYSYVFVKQLAVDRIQLYREGERVRVSMPVTTTGTVTTTVTHPNLVGSPLSIVTNVTSGDSATTVAGKIRDDLVGTTAITDLFDIELQGSQSHIVAMFVKTTAPSNFTMTTVNTTATGNYFRNLAKAIQSTPINLDTALGSGSYTLSTIRTQSVGILSYGCQHCTFSGNRIIGTTQAGISISDSYGNRITDNVLDRIAGGGNGNAINLTNVVDSVITNNQFLNSLVSDKTIREFVNTINVTVGTTSPDVDAQVDGLFLPNWWIGRTAVIDGSTYTISNVRRGKVTMTTNVTASAGTHAMTMDWSNNTYADNVGVDYIQRTPLSTSVIKGGINQVSKSADYTLVWSDRNKQIFHPSTDTTARTWTIDSNANVPYPIGTTLTFINETGAGNITLAITSDTLLWSPSGGTGSRTLAANGIATAVKISATKWIISGNGLS